MINSFLRFLQITQNYDCSLRYKMMLVKLQIKLFHPHRFYYNFENANFDLNGV